MKALSIRQPWAWLIAQGYKDIENRTWPTRFRGRVLIHASKGMTRVEYEDVAEFVRDINRTNLVERNGVQPIVLPAFDQLKRGGIVGVATVDGCVAPGDRTSTWHMDDRYGFHLFDAKPLPFVECKGALNFFTVPPEVATQLRQMHEMGVC